MPGTVYALLVGINDYPAPVRPLHGCVNDIESLNTFLGKRIGHRYKPRLLLNEAATRRAVIDGFRQHLRQAKADHDDVALFYYSGHGSQEQAPPEFWKIEPDRLNETLVCYNSRLPGQWDLADKELAQLIAEVAANHPHIVVMLDCCHSGSGTRAPETTPGVRLAPTDTRRRRVEDYLLSLEHIEALKNAQLDTITGEHTGWYILPPGRHVLFAACAPDEEAKEQWFEDKQHGAFTYYLLDALQQTGAGMSYRDLHKRINARVRNTIAKQSPKLEATHTADLHQGFLGGAIPVRDPYFTLAYQSEEHGWFIDGGSMHGIPPVQDHETTTLALFPQDATVEILQNSTAAVGEARVINVAPSESQVSLTLPAGQAEDAQRLYKAVITALPLPPLLVSLEGDAAAVQLVRDALNTAEHGHPSLFVREGSADQATLRVLAKQAADGHAHYRIVRRADIYSLAVDIEGHTTASAIQVVHRLEHIERWTTIANLSNKAHTIGLDAVKIELFQVLDAGELIPFEDVTNIRLEYKHPYGAQQRPRFKIKMTNTSQKTLYCALLDLTETYAVWPGLIPDSGNCVELDPKKEPVWAYSDRPIPAWIPDTLWQDGLIELKERLKVVVSDTWFDASLLEQSQLDVQLLTRGASKAITANNTLTRLMNRVQQRGLGDQPGVDATVSDWITSEFVLTIVRPQEAAPIRPDMPTALGAGVRVKPHPSLQAQARLTSVAEASRTVGNRALPPLLRNNPDVAPFEFSTGRGGEPGLSVLELLDVCNHELVTCEQPLEIELETRTLADDEYVVAVAYDEQLDLYLPLGLASHKDGAIITVERLPTPAGEGSKNVWGSIKIFFQKVVGPRLGIPFLYPLLRIAEVAEDGALTFSTDGDLDFVKAKVAAAQRILLYVHGIIGDTHLMIASARTGWLTLPTTPPALAERYDLLLAFDYESVNTTIQDNARKLKERLTAVGLGPNHGKTLHMVAHSMGGLVSRWFLEREGGGAERMVQHLVMLGTPNAGSPWPTVQDWVTTGVGIALNLLSVVALPVQVFGGLVSAIETIDVALDQMKPGDELLHMLATSHDPYVPYTIIAGNTSVIRAALEPEPGQTKSRFARLWDKIKPQQWWYATLDLAFFHQPNDIAVSVDSIQSVSSNRTPAPEKVPPVACDHVTYFSTEAGLHALAAALEQAPAVSA